MYTLVLYFMLYLLFSIYEAFTIQNTDTYTPTYPGMGFQSSIL